MFNNGSYLARATQFSIATQRNREAWVLRESVIKFDKTLRRGLRGRFLRALGFGGGKLMALNTLASDLSVKGRHYAGVQSVPIRQIQGSEGRVADFDAAFNPLNTKTRDRWLSIARTRMLGSELPPVELIQVGDRYFVRDGHHRISVARILGEFAVDAEVTVWETNGPLPWENTPAIQVQPQTI